MIDLRKNSGLPIRVDDRYHLIFDKDLHQVEPAIRTIEQMKDVLLDKTLTEPRELYFMYRDIALEKDRDLQKRNQLRYDITVIKPDRLGRELMKTAGHYHPGDFPELYDVMWGEGWCLQQKPSKDNPKKLEDVILVKAKTGEKIICLPEYGHILINPSKTEPLITSNWVSTQFSSDYTVYRRAQGAAYFVFENNGNIKIEKNKFFIEVPKIRELFPNPNIESFSLEKDKPIYPIINNNVEKLRFLNYPKEFDYRNVFVS
jgi:glucose-6-phosphate isomerase